MKRPATGFMPFENIRVRLLMWYCLLTACTTVSAVWVTRQIYCHRLDEKAEVSLMREVERFQRSTEPLRTGERSGADLTDLFNQALADYVPTEDEFVFTFVNGQLYRASQPSPDWLQRRHNLLDQWAILTAPQRQQVASSDQRLFYIAEPLVDDNGDRGVFVAVRDSTAAYQSGTEAMRLVLLVSVAVLGGFFIIAWTTAGHILRPLHLMNQTARQITQSDMTQRIPVRSNDEIATLATTFNAMLDRLQLAFDGQQEFLKDVSHELRTPITVIQGQLEMLPYRPEKQPETIALITSELAQMNRLVNDLLLLTKAERPDFLIFKPEDLDWLTEELYLKVRTFSNDRDWQLESKGLYPATIDKQRFSQAVMNLVQNAVRHTQPGDTIALGSTATQSHLRFWVRDTGEGIAPADRKRIFERFARATNNNRQFEGAGLGLSIASAIVQAHQGRIELSSELGKGSTFTLVIPLEPTAKVSEIDRHESHSNRRGQSPHRGLPEYRAESSRVQHSSRPRRRAG